MGKGSDLKPLRPRESLQNRVSNDAVIPSERRSGVLSLPRVKSRGDTQPLLLRVDRQRPRTTDNSSCLCSVPSVPSVVIQLYLNHVYPIENLKLALIPEFLCDSDAFDTCMYSPAIVTA